MPQSHDTMMSPPIENLLGRVDSKFSQHRILAGIQGHF